MKQTTIPIRSDAAITVRCNDDLCIEGIEASTLVVIVEQGDTLRMREEKNKYSIMADSECRVLVPTTAVVTVEKVSGDATLCNIKSRAIVGKIGGDLSLSQFSGASIESVGGDCLIQNALGAIEIARVGGCLHADGVQSLIAGSVGDDVLLKNLTSNLDVNAGDEAKIHTSNTNLPKINVRAGSDIYLLVPPQAQGQLEISSGDEEIVVHAGDQDLEIEEQSLSLPLGNGGEKITLRAGSSVFVSDQETPDWESDEQNLDMKEQWKNFGFDLEQRIKEGIRLASTTADVAVRQAGYATKRAQHEIRRAMRNINDYRGFQPERPHKGSGFSADVEPGVTKSPSHGPSDEERIVVLRMLQDKKITVEEAEKLLNALDR